MKRDSEKIIRGEIYYCFNTQFSKLVFRIIFIFYMFRFLYVSILTIHAHNCILKLNLHGSLIIGYFRHYLYTTIAYVSVKAIGFKQNGLGLNIHC